MPSMRRVEEAMRRHGQDPTIQTKACSFLDHLVHCQGIRALGSGVQWPQDIQERARYSHRLGMKAGMPWHDSLPKVPAKGALLNLQRPLEAERRGGPACSEAMCQHASDVELQIAALEAS